MKPFSLEAALAGAPVCTRDGREVTQLVKFDCAHGYCVFGVAKGGPVSGWYESGRCLEWVESNNDLFMAPIKKTGWVARWEAWLASGVYASEEEAKMAYPNALSYHKIEWEE